MELCFVYRRVPWYLQEIDSKTPIDAKVCEFMPYLKGLCMASCVL